MQQHNSFREYLDKICEQIRWKKAHSVVCRELGDHLEDEQAVLIEAGLAEDESAGQAVLDMGDAVLVGSQLDRTYRPRPAWGVIAVTAALMILGFFARLYIVEHAVNSNYIIDIPRSVFWVCAAIIVLIIGYFLDYTILGKHPLIIGAGFVVMMILIRYANRTDVFGMPYNVYYYGAYLVILIPVVYAAILWWWPYQGYCGLTIAYLALIIMTMTVLVFSVMLQALFYGVVCGIMLTIELLKDRFKIRKPIGLLILYSPIVLLFIRLWEPISRRLSIILHPELEPMGRGFQASQIRLVLESARWIGQGGHAANDVPSLVNDHMLTFFIYQFGWISLVLVLVLFGALLAFSAVLISKQKSRLGRMVSLAILLSLAIQGGLYIVNNLGMVWGGFAILPLLSYGNAALLIDSFLIGLMLSVFRNDDIVRDPIIAPKRIPRIKITMERLP